MFYTIQNSFLTVKVNSFGAELTEIKGCKNTQFLWDGAREIWPRHSPVLFPYVGRLTRETYTLNGKKTCSMGLHGFAWHSEFEAAIISADLITLVLKENEETLRQYPFKFSFYITYALDADTLKIDYTVKNENDGTADDMYFGIGGHPGFRVPLNPALHFEDYYLEFPYRCNPTRIGMSNDVYVTGEDYSFLLENDQRLSLSHDLFDHDAIILKNIPKYVTLKTDLSTERISLSFPDMRYLGIWHVPHKNAPYICIEPWSSLNMRKDVVEDFACHDSLIRLPSGNIYKNNWEIQLLE